MHTIEALHLNKYIVEKFCILSFSNTTLNFCTTYLPLLTKGISQHLRGHSFFIKRPELTLIVYFNELLAASSRERNVELTTKENKKKTKKIRLKLLRKNFNKVRIYLMI